jgi:hypothetical protein
MMDSILYGWSTDAEEMGGMTPPLQIVGLDQTLPGASPPHRIHQEWAKNRYPFPRHGDGRDDPAPTYRTNTIFWETLLFPAVNW